VARLKQAPLHPFLISAYAILALLAYNQPEIRLTAGIRALLVGLAGTGLLLLFLRFLFEDWKRAALLCSFLLLLFFTYGHIYNLSKDIELFGFALGRHRFLAPLWAVLLAVGFFLIIRRREDAQDLTGTLNLFTLVILLFPILQILIFQTGELWGRSESVELPPEAQDLQLPADGAPDVYYIILDAYTRDDSMEAIYHLDNTPFLSSLEEMGFYVARCSQSNYAQTRLSLASSLNMNYLDAFYPEADPDSRDFTVVNHYLRDNQVREIFQSLGYQVVAFETGFSWTEWRDADIFLKPQEGNSILMALLGGLNDFEALLLKTTATRILIDLREILPEQFRPNVDENPREIHRQRVLFDLQQLETLPAIEGPKFVFAHIVSPHRPFVFGPNGEFIDEPDDYPQAYHAQVSYLNQRLEELIPKILEASERPPIIILQGDHGGVGNKTRRVHILNAYLLPDDGELLYESISPVNTFRVIFNTYFGGNYELLDDISYFSTVDDPYELEVIPLTRPGCE